jgi:Tfp pilus assembly PilM family ATPase
MQVSGLEITDSKVALLSLKKAGNSLKISGFIEKILPPGTIKDGVLEDKKGFVTILQSLKRDARPKAVGSPYVVVSLPENLVYLTRRILPKVPEERIREAIEINLREFLPGKSENIYWGFQELGEESRGKEIQIASARKELVESYLGSFSESGFSPVALEPSSLSVARAFSNEISDTLVLTLDGSYTSAVILEKGVVSFATSFAAEKPEDFSSQIRRIINYYRAEKKNATLKIFLASKNITDELLRQYRESTNMEVVKAADKMVLPEKNYKSPIVFGAALRGLIDQRDDRGLSLLPLGSHEAYEEKRALHFLGGIVNLVGVTSLLFLIIFFGFWGMLIYLNRSVDQQMASLATTKVDPEVTQIEKNLQTISPKLSYMKGLLGAEDPTPSILAAIQSSAGTDVILTNITQTKESKTTSITGSASSRDALSKFKDGLNASKLFTSVDISQTNAAASQISFTITLTKK